MCKFDKAVIYICIFNVANSELATAESCQNLHNAIFILSQAYFVSFKTFHLLFWFFNSPDLPESEATFAITGGGIADAKE